MSPRTTEIQKEARRTQIIQAACKCFADKGFHGTTMRAICRRSGLSMGAVYCYFASKDDLIRALGELGRKNTKVALDSYVKSGTATGQLAEVFDGAIAFLISADGIENARLSIRLWGEALQGGQVREVLVQGVSAGLEPLEAIASEGLMQRRINPELGPTSIARIWHAVYMGLSVQAAVDPAVDLTACAKVVSALFSGDFSITEFDED